jgi:hypothetical protein
MHLFSRVATLTGGPAKPLDWATRITAKVNEVTSLETSLWTAAFGYPGGTVAWSTVVESRAQLTEEFGKLGADQGFLDLAEEGQQFAGTTTYQDTLRSVVHTTREPDSTPSPIGAVAELTTAVAAEGQLGAAISWGVEIADLATEVADVGAAFMTDDYGVFGQMAWIAIHPDAAACDAANAALAGSEKYLVSIDGAGDLFVPGSARRGSLVRMA